MLKGLIAAACCVGLISVGFAKPAPVPQTTSDDQEEQVVPMGKAGLGEPCKSAADCKGNAICRAPKGKSSPKVCTDPHAK